MRREVVVAHPAEPERRYQMVPSRIATIAQTTCPLRAEDRKPRSPPKLIDKHKVRREFHRAHPIARANQGRFEVGMGKGEPLRARRLSAPSPQWAAKRQ